MLVMDRLPIVLPTSNEVIIGEIPDITNALGWLCAFAGWALTTRKMSMMMGRGMDKTLPGLEDFYMIGQ